jgi:hypothetical protein
MSYSNSSVMRYKQGFIYIADIDGNETIRVTVDRYAYIVYVKSIHAAKLLITKHSNKINEV